MSEAFDKMMQERKLRSESEARTQRLLMIAGGIVLVVAMVILFLRDREGLINPNTASAKDLITLPEIGPETATKILKLRPFKDSADFEKRVPGIGPKSLAKMQSRLDFDGDGKADIPTAQ